LFVFRRLHSNVIWLMLKSVAKFFWTNFALKLSFYTFNYFSKLLLKTYWNIIFYKFVEIIHVYCILYSLFLCYYTTYYNIILYILYCIRYIIVNIIFFFAFECLTLNPTEKNVDSRLSSWPTSLVQNTHH